MCPHQTYTSLDTLWAHTLRGTSEKVFLGLVGFQVWKIKLVVVDYSIDELFDSNTGSHIWVKLYY